jgi:hypothetical protein
MKAETKEEKEMSVEREQIDAANHTRFMIVRCSKPKPGWKRIKPGG